jgi:HPt (histidine-containing phosphotransfer) domain-containing protein
VFACLALVALGASPKEPSEDSSLRKNEARWTAFYLDAAKQYCVTRASDGKALPLEDRAVLDWAVVCRSAHTLKSTANYLGAKGLADVALRVELLARDGGLACAVEQVAALENTATRFLEALAHAPEPAAAR